MFAFDGIQPVPDDLVEASKLQKAMLFELAMARAEFLLNDAVDVAWEDCLRVAAERQRRHFDAEVPDKLDQADIDVAAHAATNLIAMLHRVQAQNPHIPLEQGPAIPGLGWIASGNGDFALGPLLIEVKHTDRNFVSGDFRQVLIYWLLKYAKTIESDDAIWSNVLLLNPRRNAGLLVEFDFLLKAASSNSNRIELYELLRSIVDRDPDRR